MMKNVTGSAAGWLQDQRKVTSNSEITLKEKDFVEIENKRKEVSDIIGQLKTSLKEYYEMDTNKKTGDALILAEQVERAL